MSARPVAAALLLALAGVASAQQGDLLNQVRDSGRAAAQLEQQREARFTRARDEQAALLKQAQAEAQKHEARVAAARKRWETARQTSAVLEKKLADASRDLEILYDAARGAAVDLHDTAEKSLVTPQFPDRVAELAPLAATQTLPGPAELEKLWRALELEMEQTGAVVTFKSKVAGPDGEAERDVTRVGAFTASSGRDYLVLAPGAGRFVEMDPQPSRHFRRLAESFAERTDGVARVLVDPSSGALLVAEANRPGLFERLWHGGLGGYFIGAILLFAIGLAIVQATWLRSRLIIDEQSISVVVSVLVLFALLQWGFWRPGEGNANPENIAQVELVSEEQPQPEDEPPPPDITPPPPPPEMPTPSENALAGLPALAAPTAAPLLSNIQVPVKIAGGGSLTGLGFGGFSKGTGTGAGTYGNGKGFSGKPLIPLSTARPQMPEWACKQGIKGWVEAVFTVLPNGRVQDVKIVDAQPRGVYEVAAIESISNWIYAESDSAREVKQRVPMDPSDCAYNWR